MALPLEPKKINLATINNGVQYVNGDGVQAETITDVVQGAAYADVVAQNAKDAVSTAVTDINQFKIDTTTRVNELEVAIGQAGTTIRIDGSPVAAVDFTRDPQTQINEKFDRETKNLYPVVDLNDAIENGWYSVPSSVENKPTLNGSYIMEVLKYNNNYINQRAIDVTSVNRKTYERRMLNGVWQLWNPIYGNAFYSNNVGTNMVSATTYVMNGVQTITGKTKQLPDVGTTKIFFPLSFLEIPTVVVTPEYQSFWIAEYEAFTINVFDIDKTGFYIAVTGFLDSMVFNFIAIGRTY